jgi:type I site-specific restriction-modification system R (restriction) subunit
MVAVFFLACSICTPIEKEDKSTPAVFGGYIDIYDIKQSVDDGALPCPQTLFAVPQSGLQYP